MSSRCAVDAANDTADAAARVRSRHALELRVGRQGFMQIFDPDSRTWREPTDAEMAELEARLTLTKLRRMQPGS